MGKISDAFEKREKENILKIDNCTREIPIRLEREKPKLDQTRGFRVHDDFSGELIVASAPDSADAESFRLLRSHLFYGTDGKIPGLIMVTSAFPAEGKTFVASNLAASIAIGTDKQVLLVDCDLQKPKIHRLFGLDRSEGVCEYLDRKKSLQDLTIKTKIPKLSILPAGMVSACPSESISSSGMERFMKKVKEDYQNWAIIVDSAPSHIMAGTRVIGKYVDGILFVVMAEKWPRKEIHKSIETLGKEKVLGVVFNGYARARREYHKYYNKYYSSK